jgi:predicted RNA-binding protein Jag
MEGENSQDNINNELITPELKTVLDFLETVFAQLDVKIIEYTTKQEEDGELYINFEAENMALIIGKKGAALLSLQFVVNSFIKQRNFSLRVFLDIGEYRKKQAQILKEDVDRVAEKVRKYGKSILMKGQYVPFERKQIHLFIQEMQGLKSRSEGEGFYKQIWIELQN